MRLICLAVALCLVSSTMASGQDLELETAGIEHRRHRHAHNDHVHGESEQQQGSTDEFDVEANALVEEGRESPIDEPQAVDFDVGDDAKHSSKRKGDKKSRGKGVKAKESQREKQAEQERGWHYCADGRPPKDVQDLETEELGVGHMCRELYPTSTCCYDHDLTMELVGDKILEQIPKMQCARMLMRLRCAHCSPRSWWLFHAPDKVRYPHKRVLPIMCPGFCRKFHRLCRDSVAGLEIDNFCDYHTTDQEGPCYPDSVVKRGTID